MHAIMLRVLQGYMHKPSPTTDLYTTVSVWHIHLSSRLFLCLFVILQQDIDEHVYVCYVGRFMIINIITFWSLFYEHRQFVILPWGAL